MQWLQMAPCISDETVPAGVDMLSLSVERLHFSVSPFCLRKPLLFEVLLSHLCFNALFPCAYYGEWV